MTMTAEQTEIVATVRAFVDRDVVPYASGLEHADEFPESMVETMREMGLFGTTIPEEYGGLGHRLGELVRVLELRGDGHDVAVARASKFSTLIKLLSPRIQMSCVPKRLCCCLFLISVL